MPTLPRRVAMRSSKAAASSPGAGFWLWRTSVKSGRTLAKWRAGTTPGRPGNAFAILGEVTFFEALETLVRTGEIRWGFLSAAAIVLALTPLAIRLAPLVGAVDDPGHSDRPRVHERPLPRLGGIPIVIGILVPAVVFLDLNPPYVGILIGTGAGRRCSASTTTSAGSTRPRSSSASSRSR